MINISAVFNSLLNPNKYTATYSLSGHLEAIVGGYWVEGEGYDEFIRVYYNPNFDVVKKYDLEFVIQENLIAYISLEHHYVLVKGTMAEKFKKDTKDYGLSYFLIESFDNEQYYYTADSEIPSPFKNIVWIDDSFLNDDNLEFNFKAFEYIDKGNKYLNPNHFSINQMMNYLYSPWRL